MTELSSRDRIITTRCHRKEADRVRMEMADTITALGMQGEWGIYVKPYWSLDTRGWSYAICVGKHAGA